MSPTIRPEFVAVIERRGVPISRRDARRGIPEEVRRALVGHVPRDVHAGYNYVDLKRLVEAVNAIP